MKTLIRAAVVTGIAATSMLFAAVPAQAAGTPALVDCSFAGVYDSFDGTGAGLQGYAKRDDHLTVNGGGGEAWYVHVDDGFMAGADGWVESDCVAFLA